MQTEALFENIADHIAREIHQAQHAVFVAVAWFTNRALLDALVQKAEAGCAVSLLVSDDAINRGSRVDFERLNTGNSRVYWVGNGDTELMYNKFCVIDRNTVITGSYNWSYKAESNFENIVITKDDTLLAGQFIAEFRAILKKYYPKALPEETDFPIAKIIRRLEILKNYILLEETEDISSEARKLKAYEFNTDLAEISAALHTRAYAEAVRKIGIFISQHQQLSKWTDPEIAALKLEIKNLENQLSAYDNEKAELEKNLSDFHYRHTQELGEILLEILRLRKVKYRHDEAKYQEAEQDEREYREEVETERERVVFELSDEEKAELKKAFRKATTLCHPDKVADSFKEAAQKVFIELKTAYDANNLELVSQILAELERGNGFKTKSEAVSEKNALQVEIGSLRRKIEAIIADIIAIKESETYAEITGISDWDAYFGLMKEKLAAELAYLKSTLAKPSDSVAS